MTHRINDNGIDRDMTAEEETALDAVRAEMETQAAAADDLLRTRASARAKLVDLGLSETEIAALVG